MRRNSLSLWERVGERVRSLRELFCIDLFIVLAYDNFRLRKVLAQALTPTLSQGEEGVKKTPGPSPNGRGEN